MQRTITCVGIATLDRVWFVAEMPTASTKIRSRNYLEVGGGQAANAAVAIARLGGGARIVSVVGNDAAAGTIVSQFDSEGVDTRFITRAETGRSVTAAVVVDSQGERTIIADVDPQLANAFTRIDDAALTGTDIMLVDVKWPQAAGDALEKAKRAGITTVIDVEPTAPGHNERLCPLADHVIFGQAGLTAFTGCEDPRHGLALARAQLGGLVGVTLGAQGALIWDGTQPVQIPAPRIAAVDTTGAGDAFHGAYALAIAEGRPPLEAARFANAVAALKCTKPGGREGLPTRSAVEQMLKGA